VANVGSGSVLALAMTVLVVTPGGDSPGSQLPGDPSVSLTPTVTAVSANADDLDRIDDALARFRYAGLELPDLTITFHDEEASCDGHDGLFRESSGGWAIDVCSDLDFVIPHELAHAWAAANLDEDDRARYLKARGLTVWTGGDVPWEQRGTEDAAFIVQQNLRGINIAPSSATWTERMQAYAILTGSPSPAGDLLCPV
jgi:hypothetical protein